MILTSPRPTRQRGLRGVRRESPAFEARFYGNLRALVQGLEFVRSPWSSPSCSKSRSQSRGRKTSLRHPSGHRRNRPPSRLAPFWSSSRRPVGYQRKRWSSRMPTCRRRTVASRDILRSVLCSPLRIRMLAQYSAEAVRSLEVVPRPRQATPLIVWRQSSTWMVPSLVGSTRCCREVCVAEAGARRRSSLRDRVFGGSRTNASEGGVTRRASLPRSVRRRGQRPGARRRSSLRERVSGGSRTGASEGEVTRRAREGSERGSTVSSTASRPACRLVLRCISGVRALGLRVLPVSLGAPHLVRRPKREARACDDGRHRVIGDGGPETVCGRRVAQGRAARSAVRRTHGDLGMDMRR